MSDTDKPINLAVALEYERGTRNAPRITAKGRGELARRIADMAEESGVVIDANGPLAEALAGVELDEEIPMELYEAVAEIIGFVLRATETRR
ncbi:EscU/YscU/HrcU family type III secretion system export apparatus switch protein [Devosia sp. CN2-171]|jgi:flagellar biosynthesis protein|uniref:EscU/YscU/HrcU family type III secretion system export apparatus switch protein n=1 Tax=Devosia sp. CN2-171 TaxID=3400909 RepID=UPI003BF7A51B